MSSEQDRRLIEDYLPIEAISKEASREKSVRKGHISTLHLWWARRPLVACRAAVYGALVPASRFTPKNGPEEKRASLTRANAAKFVDRLCRYPGDPSTIADAQRHILEAHAERLTNDLAEAKVQGHRPAWADEFKFFGDRVSVEDVTAGRVHRPRVLDMFAGGGAIPLEALRLGCESYAMDLNPVAYIIELCTLVYPQKYGNPAPDARGMTGPKNAKSETTWGGLAKEVRYWGEWVLKKVKAEIGDLYPLIPDPAFKGNKQPIQVDWLKEHDTDDVPPGYLMPVAYLWTRTVTCKNPNCRATVPLVKQTWLCKKKDRYIALKIIAPRGKKQVHFEVVETRSENGLDFDPAGFSKGGNATCPFCGTVADSDHVKTEGCAGHMGQQMMGIACTQPGKKGKVYLAADDFPDYVPNETAIRERIEKLCKESGLRVPDEPIINDAKNANFCVLYGIIGFKDLFLQRQMLSLLTFAACMRSVQAEMNSIQHEEEHLRAVMTHLGTMVDKLADFSSSLCHFNYTGGRGSTNTFGRQALGMTWVCDKFVGRN